MRELVFLVFNIIAENTTWVSYCVIVPHRFAFRKELGGGGREHAIPSLNFFKLRDSSWADEQVLGAFVSLLAATFSPGDRC